MEIADESKWVRITVALLWAAGVWGAEEPQPKIIGSPTLLVDRISGGGKASVYLVNTSNADVAIVLSANVNSASKTSRTKVLFSKSEAGPGSETLNFTAKRGVEAQSVWVFVSDAFEPGDTDVDLFDKDIKLGKLKIRRLPFTVKLDGPSPDKAELSLRVGKETRILLKNDDPVQYKLAWRLFLSGTDVCSGKVEIEPCAIAELRCTPKLAFTFREPLKEQTLDGQLMLTEENDQSKPLRTFPAKATASLLTPGGAALAYILVILILICGGICSLLLSNFLPNRLQRLNLKDQLDAIFRTIEDLSDHIDPKLALQVRDERSRLNELLGSRTDFSPEFAGVVAQCTQGIARLTSRVQLLQQMDLVLARRENLTRLGVAPTLVDQMDAQIDKAVVLLSKKEPADADIQVAAGAVNSAASQVDTLIHPGADFGQSLSQRVRNLVTEINANFVTKAGFEKLNEAAPAALKQLQAVKTEATISADQYTSLDLAVAKVLVMQEYATLVEGTTHPNVLAAIGAIEPSLTKYLQVNSWEALRTCRHWLREIRDGVYPEMLVHALKASEAEIKMDRVTVYDRTQVNFNVQFQFPPYNSSAAREALTCVWRFPDIPERVGWEVPYYFEAYTAPLPWIRRFWRFRRRSAEAQPICKICEVTATFRDENGEELLDTTTNSPLTLRRKVEVRAPRAAKTFGERVQMEALKLAAALLIAVFGLVAGAMDQLAKLDLLPGLIAVFMVGFGADTVKNLLTNK